MKRLNEPNVRIEELSGTFLVTWVGPISGLEQAALFMVKGNSAKAEANARNHVRDLETLFERMEEIEGKLLAEEKDIS